MTAEEAAAVVPANVAGDLEIVELDSHCFGRLRGEEAGRGDPLASVI